MRRNLTELLRECGRVQRESLRTGVPADEVFGRRMERREFLMKAAAAGGVAAAGSPLMAAYVGAKKTRSPRVVPPNADARIAVVGAGLAGMTAAYRLWQAGYKPIVYEGDSRIGGRTETIRNFFDHGQIVEACGFEINSNHTAMRFLVAELGLTLDNLWSFYPPWDEFKGLVWVKGHPYLHREIFADFQEVYPALRRDLSAAPWPTTYASHTAAAIILDNMTLAEWIHRNVPGGLDSRFGKFLEVAYVGEYGLEIEEQSALNLIYEAGYSTRHNMNIWGNQDWKWHVHGGNDLVTSTMADRLPPGTVMLGAALAAIVVNGDGSYTLTLDGDAGIQDVTADRVVLALPFTKLRQVDYSKAGFDSLKDKAIQNLGMGTNARLYIQFKSRPWEVAGYRGDAETDLPFQETEIIYPTSKYPGGILDIYTGGDTGASYQVVEDGGATPPDIVRTTLAQLETIYPGARKAYSGKSYIHVPTKDEWFLGSYSCPKPGEYTSIYGSEKLPQGGVHFAGEHTSIDWIGFMNGAVESGERASAEVIQALS